MLNIFILFGHSGNSGGVVDFCSSLIPVFDKSRFQIKHIRNDKIQKYKIFNFLPVRLLDLLVSYIYYSLLTIYSKPSVVHLNPSLDKKSLYRDYVYLLISKLFNKKAKIVTHFHGWNSMVFEKNNILRKILLDFLDKSDHIIVLAKLFKRKLLNHNIPERKISVITTAVDTSLYIEKENRRNNHSKQFQVLFLSRMLEDKGIFVLVDAISQIASSQFRDSFNFVFAGDGKDKRRLEEKIRQLNLDEYVSMPGYVTGIDKVKLLSDSDIFVFPSNYGEGCPVAVLEAMASGLPLITSKVGALSEIIDENLNCIFIDPNHPQQIVESLRLLKTDKVLRERMTKLNIDKAKNEFDIHIIASKVANIYSILSKDENKSEIQSEIPSRTE